MKRYFILTNLLLIPLALYFGVQVLYLITTAQLDSGSMLSKSRQATAAFEGETDLPITNYQPIIERNLFNTKKEATQQPDAIDISVAGLKPTALKLRLLGTVTGDQDWAYAVIEDEKDRQQNLFKVGDEIQDATLKMILRGMVVLSVMGKDEVLEIEKISDGGKRKGRSSRATREAKLRGVPKTQQISLKRSALDEAIANLGGLMKGVNIQPHFEDGKPDGIRLSRIKRQSIFRKMGLRRGDIITGVDGQKIESVDDALSLYDSLTSASSVKLEIKRKGRARILDYNIK